MKIYILGVGGIGVSAIARYYLHMGWTVYGSDTTASDLTKKLEEEGVKLTIGNTSKDFEDNIGELNLLVYTDAVPNSHPELVKATEKGIETLKYSKALANIVNDKKLIAVTGTHGKSTTSSLVSIVLKESAFSVNSIVGTILKEFSGKNSFFSDSDIFVIEACEYKRNFLEYKPTLGVITNIELDHLDYYKNLADYISAYEEFIDNIIPSGFLIINGKDKNCKGLIGKRKDISYIVVYEKHFEIISKLVGSENGKEIKFPNINMQIPGDHTLFDAHIAYIVGYMFGIQSNEIVPTLEGYQGVWRRMEMIKETINGNMLMSDYGHHPTEIYLTTQAIKRKYPDKDLFVIFQPHQYNRTIELLDGFKKCFSYVDKLVVPNIYESRDTEQDKKEMNSETFVKTIRHNNKLDGKGLENTLSIIKDYDKKNPGSSIILLMGAGDVDDLRNGIN